MSQRIKLKFFPFPDMVASLVGDLAEQGFDVEMAPCDETDHYVLIAERLYDGEEKELMPDGPTIH